MILGIRLGRYPSVAAAASTFSLVLLEILAFEEKARETAAWDTPAHFATSIDVTERMILVFLGSCEVAITTDRRRSQLSTMGK